MIKKAAMEITSDVAGFIGTAVKDLTYKIKSSEKVNWWVTYLAKWLILVLVIIAYTIVVGRVAQAKALKVYEGWLEDYRLERMAIDQANADADPYTLQLNAEAESLAQILYGVKDNDKDDLRTLCWCVFNRVDNPAFPNTLEDVISQPQQWMRYDAENPVLEDLYQIAREQLEAWRSDAHRPCSSDYVFMSWTPSDICLRDAWREGSGTHYWRMGQ